MYTLKKSLGQHFLRDENISRKIVAALRQRPFIQLLEVGPGAGALTRHLIGLGDVDFKAVELDEEKVHYLQETYPVLQGKLIHASILDIEKPFPGKFTVIGNFPYNISSQILFKMLDWKDDLETIVGMFQKEVAQRVAAKEGNKTYGVLSVLIQAFFDVEYLFEVHEQCFNPPPKVKSAVIRLTPRQAPAFRDEKSFFLLVKTAFNQRRKTLRNAVRSLFDETALVDPIFDRRAEQLSVTDFAQLTWKMR
ncbi:16S rRNA (adenine(1518)-N(6)/adenine(1519)-N(6))-dimethyltransferase RsmA [Puia dinghuensis]|uniref:Ribosomal RNA small subunit methyltransferase A n=1 Tax=Puia dinghuensis TaxID=1792502 RepID=A0A8J2XTZ4_9BACT|nr:16S rRNA (adenine(1518)-N(6)/adenine(1519)-N(6))-dimethyltransferase RsmA [Puia dinghuensis]GGB07089.1 ribosomal RNA small subunit methyltransferase A [Puia dinghuensis]